MKNLAGFNRDFRFTGQKHIYAAKKKASFRMSQQENQTERKYL